MKTISKLIYAGSAAKLAQTTSFRCTKTWPENVYFKISTSFSLNSRYSSDNRVETNQSVFAWQVTIRTMCLRLGASIVEKRLKSVKVQQESIDTQSKRTYGSLCPSWKKVYILQVLVSLETIYSSEEDLVENSQTSTRLRSWAFRAVDRRSSCLK